MDLLYSEATAFQIRYVKYSVGHRGFGDRDAEAFDWLCALLVFVLVAPLREES